MKNKDIYKHCFYFKGEDECPFSSGTTEYDFWKLESYYFRMDDDEFRSKWEQFAIDYPHDEPAIEPFLINPLVDIETKGFLCYAAANFMCHSPLSISILEDYGKGMIEYPIDEDCDSLADLPEYKKIAVRTMLIEYCKFYRGELENPFSDSDICSSFWNIEFTWVNYLYFDDSLNVNYVSEFYADFPDRLKNISEEMPDSLKAFLYQQYCQEGGSKDDFPSLLIQYVESALLMNSRTSS